jgi:hypothetical protein
MWFGHVVRRSHRGQHALKKDRQGTHKCQHCQLDCRFNRGVGLIATIKYNNSRTVDTAEKGCVNMIVRYFPTAQ